jgi:hypothetical protein
MTLNDMQSSSPNTPDTTHTDIAASQRGARSSIRNDMYKRIKALNLGGHGSGFNGITTRQGRMGNSLSMFWRDENYIQEKL